MPSSPAWIRCRAIRRRRLARTDVTLPDAFVAKLNPGTTTGAQLLYCTYLGGTGTDVGLGIGLDASGNAYVTGSTNSPAFPLQTAPNNTIKGPQQSLGGGIDAFVGKISNPATGTGNGTTNVQFLYFTYLGGSADDVGNAIAVDSVQGAEVVGTTKSSNFPVTATHFKSKPEGHAGRVRRASRHSGHDYDYGEWPIHFVPRRYWHRDRHGGCDRQRLKRLRHGRDHFDGFPVTRGSVPGNEEAAARVFRMPTSRNSVRT